MIFTAANVRVSHCLSATAAKRTVNLLRAQVDALALTAVSAPAIAEEEFAAKLARQLCGDCHGFEGDSINPVLPDNTEPISSRRSRCFIPTSGRTGKSCKRSSRN